ncbi:hypothetical protein [Tissierella sp.]|uniref:hypothetical protein n=1 Tax=Tissierella sp. TaxID=41274 RepID=UPI002862BE0B|nr:hypothetical protein [Tissierella sp.]MDR7857561.1 hypothetical protein [Tissierella sp.]
MKKVLIWLLVFTMLLGSIPSFAADRDVIHTGLKKIYRAGDTDALINDVMNNIGSPEFLSQYYREETIDGVTKYVNVVDEENAHLAYVSSLIASGVKPEDLAEYLKTNAGTVGAALSKATSDVAKTFEQITDPNKGKIEEYIGNTDALKLKSPDNYSTPIPGLVEHTTRIMILTRPSSVSSTKWLYKIVEAPVTFSTNDELKDGEIYTAGKDIAIAEGKYILLCAADSSNRIKAYANIKITADMLKKPRVKVDAALGEDIDAKFEDSKNKSGATVVSRLPVGTWKVAILDSPVGEVFQDSTFAGSLAYTSGMELVLANEAEQDNMDGFEKDIIVYSVKDGIIEKYKVFELSNANVSGALEAGKLVMKIDDETEYNFSAPEKGGKSGTTKIAELKGLEGFGASKWMYAFVENDTDVKPKLDRIYGGSLDYVAGQDIVATAGSHLMILATDSAGKVRAYGIVTLEDGMIKDPLAMVLSPETHYRNIKKGSDVGETNITLSSSTSLDNLFDTQPASVKWRYIYSKDKFDIPELNSFMTDTNELTTGSDFVVVTESQLMAEEVFARNLLILATEGNDDLFKIKGYAMIPLTREHVKYPIAKELVENTHYSTPEKGPGPATTKISTLHAGGIDGHSTWWYKVVKAVEPAPIEYKDVINTTGGYRTYTLGSSITANPNDYLVLVSVDKNRRALAYKNILLKEENVTAATATNLKSITDYEGPIPGTIANSTRFTKFYNNTPSAVKWMVKIGDKSLGTIESGMIAKSEDGFVEYNVGDNIANVSPNKWILLVRTDIDDKINGYANIQLRQEQVRSINAKEMNTDNYKIEKGVNPGSTRLYDLNRGGIEGSPHTGWKWMYKLIDTKLTGENIPYFNQKLEGVNLPTNGNVTIGNGSDYGYILLLATDGNGLTKAYAQILVTSDDVRASAPPLAVNIGPGDSIDRVKFIGTDSSYMYKTDTKLIPAPALDDVLYGATNYIVSENVGISGKAGTHLMIYKVDGDMKIKSYKAFVIKDTDIKKGEVEVESQSLLEGSVKNGGQIISFTLKGVDEWNDVKYDANIRNKLYAGLRADKQNTEWLKVVSALQTGGPGNIFVEGNKINIRIPATEGYNISEEQSISLVVPFEPIKGAINPVIASNSINIKPTLEVNISGTVVSNIIREKDIKVGGATIVLTLTDAFWNMDVKEILNDSFVEGIADIDQPNTNWAKIKTAVIANPSSVVVTNERVVTITLPKVDGVAYGSDKEVISLTIDESYIQGADTPVEATPKFTIYPNVLKVDTELVNPDNKVIMQAPDNKVPLASADTWTVKLTNSTLKDNITDKDVTIIGMPAGLKPVITRLSDKELAVKMTGIASSSLVDGSVRLVVKGTAVKELNSIDSNELSLPYIKGTPMDLSLVKYEIKADGIYLSMPSGFEYGEIRYSLDSTNGINGEWHSVTSINHRVNELVGPLRIYVDEEVQPKVFKEIVNLNHPIAPLVRVKGYEYKLKDEKYLANITLESEVANLEYSKNNGLEWSDLSGLPDKKVTDLDASSILIVRTKGILGETGVLPSLATPKLNGVFLGDVKLDVSQSKIDGATTTMQYSLNSDINGNGGSWNAAKTLNPTVSFAKDNIVWIREGNSEINKRYIGTVSQVAPLPTDIKDFVDYSILDKTMTNKSDVDLQYRIANGNWFNLDKKSADADSLVNNVVFSPGLVEVRRRGNSNELPSAPILVAEIALAINPPELKFDNDTKTIKYFDNGIFNDLDVLFEYKLGATGDWKNGGSLSTDEGRNGDVTVFVRKKPTKTSVASKEVNFNFTKNISFTNVSVNVAGGVIDGTTTLMQYSTDSTTGKDGNWTPAANGKTNIKFVPGMNLYIREKDKPNTFRKLFENLGREAAPVLAGVTYDVLANRISNGSAQNLEYRIAEESWIRLDANSDKMPAGLKAGKLEFRKSATATTLESISVTKVSPFDIITAEGSAPVIDYNDTINIINSINSKTSIDWDIFEYRVDSTSANTWSNGIHLSTQDLSGDKNVEIRIKATSTTLASKIALVKFTKNLDLYLVTLSDYTKPYELNGTTTDMEYKIIYLDGKEAGWNKCLKDTTPLVGVMDTTNVAQIILRDGKAGHIDNERIIRISNVDSAPVGVKIESYDYSVAGKVLVKLVGVDNAMEYKTSDEDTWTPIIGTEANIDLSTNYDLRVRVATGSNGQPSISTSRLNGLYLGDVTIKAGKLIGTNTSMEYSLDNGTSWKTAIESETAIEMKLGNKIMIRQLNNHINNRFMGEIAPATAPNPSEIDYSIINKKIVADIGLEYRIAEGPWIEITKTPVTDVNFMAGNLEFRTKSNGLNLTSGSIIKATIAKSIDTPEITAVDTGATKSIEYYDTTWKPIDSNFEYKVGSNGNWKPASDFATDTTKDGKVMVFVRKVATHKTLPRNEKYVNFDASMTFDNVKANIALGRIENTTNSMEYSINSSDGLDGSWNPTSNTGSSTNIGFVEGMNVWIREKAKPANVKHLLVDLGRENIPIDDDLDFNIAVGNISNTSSSNLEFRIKKGSWQKLAANTTINYHFTDGSLEFRRAATVDKLESLSKERFVIKAAASAPVVTFDDVANNITSINGGNTDWENYQYRIVGESTNWIQGELLLTDIDLSGKKTLQIRRKADPITLASQIATIDFTQNLELSHVTLSKHVSPYELNGTTAQMEYNIYLTLDRVVGWEACTDGNTKMPDWLAESMDQSGADSFVKLEIRDSNQHANIVVIVP